MDAPLDPEAVEANIKNLEQHMRLHPQLSVEECRREILKLQIDTALVDEAVRIVLEERAKIANDPRVPVIRQLPFEPWYIGPRTDIDRCWPSLEEQLSGRISKASLDDVDAYSTKVVANLQNPATVGTTYGLVLGFVQSGKTTNFTAVIAKAADVGYRFFIVLSGMHNSLRQQTQDRLSEELWEPNKDLWHKLTEDDDFRPTTNNVDSLLAARGATRVLAVVKKNSTVLRKLRTWLSKAEPKILQRCPILVIDDEADQASLNTAKPGEDPKAVNRLIRDIVKIAAPVSYVGYTATPFANVLTDPEDEGNLYPRDFMLSLPRPVGYLGPETLFGRDSLNEDDPGYNPGDDGYDMIRTVPDDDIAAVRPGSASERFTFTAKVPPSLQDALRYFLMSTAARRHRRETAGQNPPHATALVHTSQHVQTHNAVAAAIKQHLGVLRTQIDDDDLDVLEAMKQQWAKETDRVEAQAFDQEVVTWDQIRTQLAEIAEQTAVITDNSQSTERLSFDVHHPRTLIAVGGNTLSRGLTLPGLSVSYFVRSASAYDTVLQMGRWFGYREGYIDVTRIWMTAELETWFRHLAGVEQEIREDISRYENSTLGPRDVGVRIRTHPAMAVAAASKMRKARTAKPSYAGRQVQTTVFQHRNTDVLEANLAVTRELLGGLEPTLQQGTGTGSSLVFKDVDYGRVTDFVGQYNFHPDNSDMNSKRLLEYIEDCLSHGELESWTVAVMSRAPDAELGTVDFNTGSPIPRINRSRRNEAGDANINTLMSPPDRAVDLDAEVRRRLTPGSGSPYSLEERSWLRNTPAQGGRGDGSPLLLVYPISPKSRPRLENSPLCALEALDTVVGVGMVFPDPKRPTSVEYVTVDLSGVGVDYLEVPDLDDMPADA